tara:strand:- start:199 stop:441 length:243 start_codon:yes stop_codon:yes gene_type:complete
MAKARKLSQIIKELKELKTEFGDLPIVTSIDDEGNGFNEVLYSPTPMKFEDTKYGLELLWEHLEKLPNRRENKPTHICIN